MKLRSEKICGLSLPLNKVPFKFPIQTIPFYSPAKFSLCQFAGKYAEPIVRRGEKVSKGQKIAENSSVDTVPVYSSISGRVSNVTDDALSKNPEIIVEPVDDNSEVETRRTHSDYFRYTPKELTALIQQSGIVGLGGTGYPLHLKIKQAKERDVRTLIINGAECDPFLSADDALMQAYAREVVLGIRMIMYILDIHQTICAVQEDKQRALELLRNESYHEPNLFIVPIPVIYPIGEERQLIYSLSGIPIPTNENPLDRGVLVINVATIYAVSRAIKNGEPYHQRLITVNGNGIETPMNVWAPNGMQVRDVLQYCGGITGKEVDVIAGGVMNGIKLQSDDISLKPTIRGILALRKDNKENNVNSPCIKCGRCNRFCPVNLQPDRISLLVQDKKDRELNKLTPEACIECGLCSYLCPSSRSVVAQVRSAKKERAICQ